MSWESLTYGTCTQCIARRTEYNARVEVQTLSHRSRLENSERRTQDEDGEAGEAGDDLCSAPRALVYVRSSCRMTASGLFR